MFHLFQQNFQSVENDGKPAQLKELFPRATRANPINPIKGNEKQK